MGDTTKKLPFKRVQIPLDKFNNDAIPHHLEILQKHKSNIQRFQVLQEWDRIHTEQVNASRVVKQLKQLLFEMDILRAQVQDSDLERFDLSTLKSTETVQKLIKDYLELMSRKLPNRTYSYEEGNIDDPSTETEKQRTIAYLQIDESQLEEAELQKMETCFKSAEELRTELKEMYGIFEDLHKIVHDQQELITHVEDNVETAVHNVHQANKHLARAARLKTAICPVTGAVVGGCIGGPVGLIAGIKLGSLAAVACGFLGYLGGTALKKRTEQVVSPPLTPIQEENTASI